MEWVTKNQARTSTKTLNRQKKFTYKEGGPCQSDSSKPRQVNTSRLQDTLDASHPSQHSSASRHFRYIFTIPTSGNIFAAPTISSDTMLTFIAAATKRQSWHRQIAVHSHGHAACFPLSFQVCKGFSLFQCKPCAHLHDLLYLQQYETWSPWADQTCALYPLHSKLTRHHYNYTVYIT